MIEQWKDIENYEGRYQVSNQGRVKSLERTVLCLNNCKRIVPERILRPNVGTNGYLYVNLSKNNKSKTCYIHKLVANMFLGKCGQMDVDHINSCKTDNRAENLQIISHLDNVRKAPKPAPYNRFGGNNPRAYKVKMVSPNENVIYSCGKEACQKIGMNYSTFKAQMKARGYVKFNNIRIEKCV